MLTGFDYSGVHMWNDIMQFDSGAVMERVLDDLIAYDKADTAENAGSIDLAPALREYEDAQNGGLGHGANLAYITDNSLSSSHEVRKGSAQGDNSLVCKPNCK